jgi:nicotinic acetylcholine receptor
LEYTVETFYLEFIFNLEVESVFLHWLPWLLRMNRPKKKITRKTIMMNNRMKELEMKEKTSKSLLANVLDIDEDFR